MIAVLLTLAPLLLLIVAAYRGVSVILFAPVAAMLAVLLYDPALVPTVFSGVYMERMVGFLQLYLPVFLLGALFGKMIEVSGFSAALVAAFARARAPVRVMPTIVFTAALLTYGGVSLFVVVFAVYPFAAEMFRHADIPKRLMPATVALGAFTFTMDSLPGTPQIQNIIPTSFFGTTTWAAPGLGLVGAAFILVCGLAYLEAGRRKALRTGEGYGADHLNEPQPVDRVHLPGAMIAILPLVIVAAVNFILTRLIPHLYPASVAAALPGQASLVHVELKSVVAIWAVEGALIAGCLSVAVLAWSRMRPRFAEGSRAAVGGALLASVNTASEYGFGAVIAALPGFLVVRDALRMIPNPLVNEAVSISGLAAVTGSASGGLSIALAALGGSIRQSAHAAGVPDAVLHRVAAMASGGLDTLPHNGAVITLLAVTGLTHRQAYGGIFALTCVKSAAVLVVIAVYYATGLV